jgi:uncharacterized protein (DUF736 family)
MADYDNTNRGAAFKPFDTQKLILQGKLNVDGNDHKTVVIADTTKNGAKLMEIYVKAAVMFTNDKKGNENAPDYSGPAETWLSPTEKRLAGWKKSSDNGNYISLTISDKQGQSDKAEEKSAAAAISFDDTVPF